MALQKQNLQINFSGGQETKVDPWQVGSSKFLAISNIVRSTIGRLTKRNGFGALSSLPSSDYSYLTTFAGDLTAVGKNLEAYSPGSSTWVEKGSIQPISLSVTPLIRSATNQTQCDAAIAPNGLVCTVYTDVNAGTNTYKFAVADSATGQNIIAPTALVADATYGTPKVFVLGNYFIIVYTFKVSTTYHLQYLSINLTSLSVGTPSDISTVYTPAATVAFSGTIANNNLYIAWNGSDLGGAVRITYIDSTLTQHGTTVFTGHSATIVSVCADITASTAVIYCTFWTGSAAYTFAVSQQGVSILAQTETIATGTILNLASTAQNGVVTIFYEVSNNYSYDSSIASYYISTVTCTQAGVVGTPAILVRSVGLGSKAVLVDGETYFMAAYSSPYQPTYFLMNDEGKPIAKLAYGNGGGYYTTGLPALNSQNGSLYVSYLFKDLIAAVNKGTNLSTGTQTAGIFSQTGINLAAFNLSPTTFSTAEIGNNLNISGGFLWMYDGYQPVEQNFFIWPDSVEAIGVSTVGSLTVQQYFYQVTYEWTDSQGNIHRSAPSIPISYTIQTAPASFTGIRTSGSPTLTSVTVVATMQVGQAISGTGIPANTYIAAIGANTITMSQNATSGTATATTVTPTTLSSLSVNLPTLRLSYKTNVKAVIYRWSTAQQVYYQVTSLTSPLINDPTTDSLTFTDSLSDASILGNNILYTTGGIVENIGPPATNAMTLFDTRLWMIDAETEDLLYFSKQVSQGTPVEMSDLFTYYAPPTGSSPNIAGTLNCVAPMDDKNILFRTNSLYYINGNGPDNTGANGQYSPAPVFITAAVGSSNQNSIVLVPNGLMFQASYNAGIWILKRDLATEYIGAPMEAYNSATVLSSINVPGTNQVRFTLDSGITLMYDYYTNEWSTFQNVPAISSTIYQGLHTFINESGQAYQETPGAYLDGSNPVLMNFTTAWFNLAGLQGYQRAYWFFLLGQYLTPHKLVVTISYDYNPYPSQQVVISPDNYTGPWGSDATWGSGSAWGGVSQVEQWQVNLEKQQCQAIQLTVTELYDPSLGIAAGAGLTLSGIDLVYGAKKGYPRQLPASRKIG